jgi:hypothetical protein
MRRKETRKLLCYIHAENRLSDVMAEVLTTSLHQALDQDYYSLAADRRSHPVMY